MPSVYYKVGESIQFARYRAQSDKKCIHSVLVIRLDLKVALKIKLQTSNFSQTKMTYTFIFCTV